jgi:hypothetical protein
MAASHGGQGNGWAPRFEGISVPPMVSTLVDTSRPYSNETQGYDRVSDWKPRGCKGERPPRVTPNSGYCPVQCCPEARSRRLGKTSSLLPPTEEESGKSCRVICASVAESDFFRSPAPNESRSWISPGGADREAPGHPVIGRRYCPCRPARPWRRHRVSAQVDNPLGPSSWRPLVTGAPHSLDPGRCGTLATRETPARRPLSAAKYVPPGPNAPPPSGRAS